jgi:hypothetical protein
VGTENPVLNYLKGVKMKKFFVISLVFVLLVTTAVPAFAGNGNPNTHSNGNGNGSGNSAGLATGNGNSMGAKEQDKENRGLGKAHGKNKLAEDGNPKFRNQENTKLMFTPFYLQGTITSIGAGTIVVHIIHANAKVKEFMGTDLTIAINDGTQIFQVTQGDEDGEAGEAKEGEKITSTPTVSDAFESSSDKDKDGDTEDGDGDGNRVPITWNQLEVGQNVAIHGSLIDTAYTAKLITVYVNQPVGNNP